MVAHPVKHLTALSLLFLLIILNLDSLSLGLFTGGITAGSFQVILILSLQIFCGFVFRLTGIILCCSCWGWPWVAIQ